MPKVYLAVAHAPDTLLGHVEENGKVYRSQIGPDKEIGHVNLATGDVYAERFGPDKEVGRVEIGSGKVFVSRFGPDRHVGSVDAGGYIYHQNLLAPDDYIGQVNPFLSYAHSAAAMLLLVLPALETESPSAALEADDETDQPHTS